MTGVSGLWETIDELKAENARLKELLNEFSNALEFAVKQESRLIYFSQIQSCIKKISREEGY